MVVFIKFGRLVQRGLVKTFIPWRSIGRWCFRLVKTEFNNEVTYDKGSILWMLLMNFDFIGL